jgi:hypothetical protein
MCVSASRSITQSLHQDRVSQFVDDGSKFLSAFGRCLSSMGRTHWSSRLTPLPSALHSTSLPLELPGLTIFVALLLAASGYLTQNYVLVPCAAAGATWTSSLCSNATSQRSSRLKCAVCGCWARCSSSSAGPSAVHHHAWKVVRLMRKSS